MSKYLRDRMKMYLYLLVSHRLFHLKLSGIIKYNKHIKVGYKTLYNFKISRKDINYVGQLLICDGKPKLWEELKKQICRVNYSYFCNSIPKSWKDELIAN